MMAALNIGFLQLCELGIFIRNPEGTYDRWLVWTLVLMKGEQSSPVAPNPSGSAH